MTTPVHCVSTETPLLSVEKHLGLPILTWLAAQGGVILWRVKGMYGLVSKEYIQEAVRLYNQDANTKYSFSWSACKRVTPELGMALYTD